MWVVLVFLAVLALLALAGHQGAWLAARLAGEQADRARALQAAEAALRDAERDLEGRRFDGLPCNAGTPGCRPAGERPLSGPGGAGLSVFDPGCGGLASRGQCRRSETDGQVRPVWRNPALVANAATYGQYTGAPPLPDVAEAPRYLIEAFARPHGYVFRITVFARGQRPATRVMVQSVYVMAADP